LISLCCFYLEFTVMMGESDILGGILRYKSQIASQGEAHIYLYWSRILIECAASILVASFLSKYVDLKLTYMRVMFLILNSSWSITIKLEDPSTKASDILLGSHLQQKLAISIA
ncbi:14763_t:CDS:2, partial [Funneliformis mosseae]